MRKFYKLAEAGTAPGGYVVRLDGKPVRTPLKNSVLLASKALAGAMALEWAAQGDILRPATMPLTQLANTMIDKSRGADRMEMNGQLLKYTSSDLVCYFATHPQNLLQRQQAHWQPLVVWMKERYGIALETISGIQYHHQPQTTLDGLKSLIENLGAEDFTILQAAAATTGSVVIGLAFMEGRLSPVEAFQAACVDELYQMETWGEDAEAQKRLDTFQSELYAIARFRDLVRG